MASATHQVIISPLCQDNNP